MFNAQTFPQSCFSYCIICTCSVWWWLKLKLKLKLKLCDQRNIDAWQSFGCSTELSGAQIRIQQVNGRFR